MTGRPFALVAGTALLAAGLLVSGCAAGDPGAAGSFQALDQQQSEFQALDQQQSEPCDGVAPPAEPSLLKPTATVVSAVVCVIGEQYFPGEGSWEVSTVRVVPPNRIPALTAGLLLPDLSTGRVGCTLSMGVLPEFVVTLADGSRERPAVAGDGCHARRDALTALDNVAAMPLADQRRTSQVRTDIDVVAGCGTGGKSPAVWLDSGADGRAQLALPTGGKVSVCRYRPTAAQEGELAAAGTVPAGDFRHSWPTVSSTAPADCEQPIDSMQTPAFDWLLLLRSPKPPFRLDQPAADPVALVELGGCHRVVAPRGGLVGFIDRSAATTLAALADHRV